MKYENMNFKFDSQCGGFQKIHHQNRPGLYPHTNMETNSVPRLGLSRFQRGFFGLKFSDVFLSLTIKGS